GVADDGAKILKFVEVGEFAFAAADFLQQIQHLLGADAAGRAFAAGFIAAKLEEKPGDVHHAGILVHDDHAAGTHDGAELLERLILDRGVEMLRGDDAARGAAGLDGLELFAVGDAAADFVDDVAQRRAKRNFNQPGVLDLAGEREDLGTLGLLGAERGIPRGAPADDGWDGGPGFDVVDVGGFAPKTALGREGRTRHRLAAAAFDGTHERGFFAAH